MPGKKYYVNKKDSNHDDIADVFRAYGYTIIDLYHLKKSCDFVALKNADNPFDFGKSFYLVEVKSKYGKLTSGEIEFALNISFPVYVIRNVEGAENLIKFNIYNE